MLGPTLISLGGGTVEVGGAVEVLVTAGLVVLAPLLLDSLEDASLAIPVPDFTRFSFSGAAARVRDDTGLVLPLSAAKTRWSDFAFGFLSSSGLLSSSSSGKPSSAARLSAGSFFANVCTGPAELGEMSELLSSESGGMWRAGPGGLFGELASNKILLRGLGFTGEYACIMFIASGLAKGKGRAAEGVLGTGGNDPFVVRLFA